MEEDMEVEPLFEVREIDLDYEFDAPRWFDFTREESVAETCQAEKWFETAGSYSPSPFAAKLFHKEDHNNFSSSQYGDTAEPCGKDTGNNLAPEISAAGNLIDAKNRNLGDILDHCLRLGMTFNSQTSTYKIRDKPKSSKKSIFPKCSTLMKPTASQLAKQNHSRFKVSAVQNNQKNACNSTLVESQAAKRQKLEGGQSLKVASTTQQINLVHKTPKKDKSIEPSFMRCRMKLTVPHEPKLVTARRAQRARPESDTKLESEASAVHRFRARPFNRKIFENPSLLLLKKSMPRLPEFQEFHLKTLERASQHSSAPTLSSHHCNNTNKGPEKPGTKVVTDSGHREARRPNVTDVLKQGGPDVNCGFKARPLDRRILSSRGDIGIFRNTKRETTVPMAFKFHTEKRLQPTLPIDLFSKLSITSEMQPNNGSQLKLHQPKCAPERGPKENRHAAFQAGNQIMRMEKGEAFIFENRNMSANNVQIPEVYYQWTSRRYA